MGYAPPKRNPYLVLVKDGVPEPIDDEIRQSGFCKVHDQLSVSLFPHVKMRNAGLQEFIAIGGVSETLVKRQSLGLSR